MLSRLKNIGPGALVAAAFIGPGTVTTATMAGASYGYTLLWAVVFSIIATLVLQEMSMRLGVVSGMGVGEALRYKLKGAAFIFCAFWVVGAILIGNAAYEAGNISGAVIGLSALFSFPKPIFVVLLGAVAGIILWIGSYKLIEKVLISLVMLLAAVFIIGAIAVQPNIGDIAKGLFVPSIPEGATIVIIGLIGTTVVPYNLFLHASASRQRWSIDELSTARWDTVVSIVLGGLITMCILIASATTFAEDTEGITGGSDLLNVLQPVIGDASRWVIAFGFIAAGLSSAITAPLAAGYATTELLSKGRDPKSSWFRGVWLFVLIIGVLFASLDFRSTEVILFSQFANGLILPIIAIYLLYLMNDEQLMKSHKNSVKANAIAVLIILITIGLGAKSMLSALQLI